MKSRVIRYKFLILMVLGNFCSLVILVFPIIIYPKLKWQGVGMVKKSNLESVINFIHLMVLRIDFKKEKLCFGYNSKL